MAGTSPAMTAAGLAHTRFRIVTPISIHIDADACSARQEIYRVAERHALKGIDPI
jgi:hypothetical protein